MSQETDTRSCTTCGKDHSTTFQRCDGCRDIHRRAQAKYVAKRSKEDPNFRRSANLKHKFGITHADYLALLESQGGCCAICGAEDARNNRWPGGHLYVDHDHDSGVIRGLLCSPCNTGIGMLANNGLLAAAIEYLDAER